MKKLIFFILLIASIQSFGQTYSTFTAPNDSSLTSTPILNRFVPLSWKDGNGRLQLSHLPITWFGGSTSSLGYNVINVKNYGVTGNGVTDETAGVKLAEKAAAAARLPLYFPKGSYNLATWTKDTTDYLNIVGDDYSQTVITGPFTTTSTFYYPSRGAHIKGRGVTFRGFDIVFYIYDTIKLLDIQACQFRDNRRYGISGDQQENNANAYVRNAFLNFNKVVNQPNGFYLPTGIGAAEIIGNNMDSLAWDVSLWGSTTGKNYNVAGIFVGSNSDVDPTTSQQRTSNVRIIGNSIKHLFNASTTQAQTSGITYAGYDGVIDGNTIYDSNSSGWIGDTYGIYTKGVGCIISNNVIKYTAGNITSAAISLKGAPIGAPSYIQGVHNLVIGNKITGSGTYQTPNGIIIYGGTDYEILNNSIDSIYNIAIQFGEMHLTGFPSVRNIVRYNTIRNFYGGNAISGSYQARNSVNPIADKLDISYNTISGFVGSASLSASTIYAIRVRSAQGVVTNYTVENNSIEYSALAANMAGFRGIDISPDSSSSNVLIRGNKFYQTTTDLATFPRLISLSALSTQTFSNTHIEDNYYFGDNTKVNPLNVGGGSITDLSNALFGTNVTAGNFYGTNFFANPGQILSRTTVSNASYTILKSDYFIAYTTLSSSKSVTLVGANYTGATAAHPQHFVIKDESGSASGTIKITIVGTINGVANPDAVITAFGVYKFYYNGTAFFTE